MSLNPDTLPVNERRSFLERRMAHSNLSALQKAMTDAGVASVSLRAHGGAGVGIVDPDMDWKYVRDPDEVGNPDVPLLDISGDYCRLEKLDRLPLREAITACAHDMMQSLFPDWQNADEARLAVVIRARNTCEVRATLINGEEVENMRRPIEARDPLASFMDATPVLDTRFGGWYEIDSDEKAMDASRISETAIGLFYAKSATGNMMGQEVADRVRWFGLLEHKGGETLAPVVMAAQPAENADLEKWPQASHVSGQANADCYEAHREDIEALAGQEGLLVRPNHMGREITVPSESVGMEL